MAVVVGVAFGDAPVAAQEGHADQVSPDLLRKRGVAAWRAYVWSLDRATLQRSRSDLVEARRADGGEPNFTQIYLLAYAHFTLGDREHGVEALLEAQQMAPDFPGILLLEAVGGILDGRRPEALAILDTYIDALEKATPDPEFGDEFAFLAHLHRGAQRNDAGNFDGAIEDLTKALEIARAAGRKPPAEAVLRLALAHQSLAQFETAENLVLGLLAEDPANAALYYNLGILAGTRERPEEARRWHLAAIAHRRDYAEAHIKLAYLAWQTSIENPGDLVVMRRHLDAARAHLGDHPTPRATADLEAGEGIYWNAVARQYEELGDDPRAVAAYGQALHHLRHSLEQEPGCKRSLTTIVEILYRLGRPDADVAPYKERLRAIREQEHAAPQEYRSTFC